MANVYADLRTDGEVGFLEEVMLVTDLDMVEEDALPFEPFAVSRLVVGAARNGAS